MTLRPVHWWAWALIGWTAATIPVGIALGRAIARRPHQPRPRLVPQLDRPLGLTRHTLDDPAAPPPSYVRDDGLPFPQLPDDAGPSLPSAILTLGYQTDETSARYWLAICARRGADWDLQRQLWDTWQREHTPHLIDPDDQEHNP